MKINKFVLVIFCLFLLGVIFFLADREIKNREESGITYQISRFIPEPVKDLLKNTIFISSSLKAELEASEKEKSLSLLRNLELSSRLSALLRSSKATNIEAAMKYDEPLSDDIQLQKYELNFLSNGKSLFSKSSAYIDKFEDKILVTSGDGIILYFNKDDLETQSIFLSSIPSNISNFIDYQEFYEKSFLGIKDITVIDNDIYISYTRQVKKDCFNISVLKAQINFDYLNYKTFFSPDDCSKRTSIYDDNMHHAGGRILKYMENSILLSIGDFGNYEAVQKEDNYFGKIIEIDLNNPINYKIVSFGHRNTQGLLWLADHKVIISSEHGPYGGDEVNLFKVDSENNNFGWPISSYGEHNSMGRDPVNQELYDRAPLYKSHADYNFVEPEVNFTPSIGISEIIQIPSNTFMNNDNEMILVSSMGYKLKNHDENDFTIHRYTFNSNNLVENQKLFIGERIRDLKYLPENDSIIMFLENTSSIGVLKAKGEQENFVKIANIASGEQVYLKYCSACHTNGFSGAPLLKDFDYWQDLLNNKGRDKLYQNSINGYGSMPAKGLCYECSNEEIEAAVDHILDFPELSNP